MGRIRDTQSAIELPGLGIESALVLGQMIVTAAEAEKKLPPRLVRALERLKTLYAALVLAFEAPPPPQTITVDGPRNAGLQLGRSWSAMSGWLESLVQLPEFALAPLAVSLQERFFPDGLVWVRRTYPKLWVESGRRSAWLDEPEIVANFVRLEGQRYVNAVLKAHALLGKGLGITVVKPEATTAPLLSDQVDAVRGALKSYVLQVIAHVDDDPTAAELCTRLQRPLSEWETPVAAAPKEPAKDPTKDPAVTEPAGATPGATEAPVAKAAGGETAAAKTAEPTTPKS